MPSKESDVISKKIEPKLRIPLRNNVISNSLSDKSANFSKNSKLECVGGGPRTKVPSFSAHTKTAINSTHTNLELERNKDILNNFVETSNVTQRNPNHRIYQYNEDEEVIQSDYWMTLR